MLPAHVPPTASYIGYYPFVSDYTPSTVESNGVTPPTSAVASMWQLRAEMLRTVGITATRRRTIQSILKARITATASYLGAIVACRRHGAANVGSDAATPDQERSVTESLNGFLNPVGSKWRGADMTIVVKTLDVEHFLVVHYLSDLYASAANARLAKRKFKEAAELFDAAAVFAGMSARMLASEDITKQWPRLLRQHSVVDSNACTMLLEALAGQSRLLYYMYENDTGDNPTDPTTPTTSPSSPSSPTSAARLTTLCRLAIDVHRHFAKAAANDGSPAETGMCAPMIRDYALMHAEYWMVRLCVGLNIEESCENKYSTAYKKELTTYTSRCALGVKNATALAARMKNHYAGHKPATSFPGIMTRAFVTDATAFIQLLTDQRIQHDAMWARMIIVLDAPYSSLDVLDDGDIMTVLHDRGDEEDANDDGGDGSNSETDGAASSSIFTIEQSRAVAMQRHVGDVVANAVAWITSIGGPRAIKSVGGGNVSTPPPPPSSTSMDVRAVLGLDARRHVFDKEIVLTRREQLVAVAARLAERSAWLKHEAHIATHDALQKDRATRNAKDIDDAMQQWCTAWKAVVKTDCRH